MPHQLVILSGPPHAGKSSTAEALCKRYDRMLHIQVGLLRRYRAGDTVPRTVRAIHLTINGIAAGLRNSG